MQTSEKRLLSFCCASVPLHRSQQLWVEAAGWPSSRCGSNNKRSSLALCTWAELGAKLPDRLSPRTVHEELHLPHQHGALKLSRCVEIVFIRMWISVIKGQMFFFIQSSQVKVWWPSGHGQQPFYHLSVKGFQDGFSIFDTESKVRVHRLSILLIF